MNASTSSNGSYRSSNMFSCMIENCSVNCMPVYTYLDHLTLVHKVPRNYRYVCTFPRCIQILSNWYVFKRHVLGHVDNLHKTEHKTTHKQPVTVDEHLQEQTLERPEVTNNAELEVQVEEDTAPITSYSENIRDIEQAALDFTLEFHSETNFTRNDIQNIQRKVKKLNCTIAEKIEGLLSFENREPQIEFELHKYMQKLQNPFDFIETDFKLFKYLEDMNIFRLPTMVRVEGEKTTKDLDLTDDEMKTNIVIMDIEFQLRSYFSSGDILKATIENTNKLEKNSEICSIVNGELWKSIKQKYPNDILLPLSYYSDDFEINDPLSAHNKRHVLCGSYYSCPTIPEQYSSKLNNIFVACMMKKVDINEVGLNMLLKQIVHRFKKIEEQGIIFEIDKKQVKVRFSLVLLQGDNLGLHQMLSFLSFNANYYCRFCRRSREECQVDVEEHCMFLRTVQNYDKDLNLQRPSETGIRSDTAFNELPSFHAVTNISVDPMHDFFCNGVCSFGLTAVMNYCIYQKGFISLSKFNAQRTVFSKNALDSSLRRMGDITETYLSSQKCKSVVIRATASEMKAFVHYFPLIMGPFVPKNDAVWEFCKILIKLSEKILSPSFSEKDIIELNELCKMHHTQYQNLFNESLKPKQHFICHYGSVIKSSGSVSKMMNFRYEAKHKGFKDYARLVTSRQNICFTLCIKAALQFSNDLYKETFFDNSSETKILPFNFETKEYFSYVSPPYPVKINEIQCTDAIKFKGTEFKVGSYVTVTEIQRVSLFEIIDILVTKENNPYIVGRLWQIGEFDDHFLAYEVIDKTKQCNIFSIVDADGPPLNVHNVIDKMLFRKKKDFLSMNL